MTIVSVIDGDYRGGSRRVTVLVGELREVFLLLDDRVEATAATQAALIRWRELDALARKLAIKVTRVRVRGHLRLEGRRDLLLDEIRPVYRRKERVLHYILGVVRSTAQSFIWILN